ncbi:class I SAM-dependent methyltransferase [Ramlibacter sp. USB13]|uniref:Class I SAM-dependent methyltransferase n=1 Tax=Ramlibacter cellulosilyticus TaxID=2764187 RepID=A0A923MR22_9BURK|nr:class I SAM-dependent methyltransferase [Ramlibacter cellulosilyticus]MBC5782257.1 class I SAM-dependent methyltransferase [Ramlibacter cellulosilyticus]
MDPLNTATWLAPDVAAFYARASGLQAPEARVLAELRPRMERWSMLDIGVGGGRTTQHFAPAVADYTGIDISPLMVDHCRRQFGSARCRFEVMDVRDLSALGTKRFDLVLFSFNGLDYLGHDDRLRALAQVRSVCRPGALFCFSTHNMHALPHLMRLRAQHWGDRAQRLRNLRNWLRWQVVHARETAKAWRERRDWAVVNDGAHECRLRTYYIRPAAQLAQLSPVFDHVRVFSRNGDELFGERLEQVEDDWLYFLCSVPGRGGPGGAFAPGEFPEGASRG